MIVSNNNKLMFTYGMIRMRIQREREGKNSFPIDVLKYGLLLLWARLTLRERKHAFHIRTGLYKSLFTNEIQIASDVGLGLNNTCAWKASSCLPKPVVSNVR